MKKSRRIKSIKISKNLQAGALLEDFNSKFELVAEQTRVIPELKNGIIDLKEDLEVVKVNLELIKGVFKKKVDIEEFEALEHRVTLLESRLRQ